MVSLPVILWALLFILLLFRLEQALPLRLGLDYIDPWAFPDHVFYDASGKELEPTVENLGGKFFSGDSIEHMVEDDSPQGDSSGSNTVLYVALIIAVVILAIAAAIILKKRKVRMVNSGIPGREARVPLNVFTLPEPGARHCRDCPRSRS